MKRSSMYTYIAVTEPPSEPAKAITQDVSLIAIGTILGAIIKQGWQHWLDKDKSEDKLTETLINNLIKCQSESQTQLLEASKLFVAAQADYTQALKELKKEIASLNERLSHSYDFRIK
jgi:hypothetical protein